MNNSELLYKRETGNTAKIGFECNTYHTKGYKVLNVSEEIFDHYDTSDDVIELYTPEYITWLEERSEKLSLIINQ